MIMCESGQVEFLIFCIENVAEALGVSNGISDQHCMTPDYIVDDILAETV